MVWFGSRDGLYYFDSNTNEVKKYVLEASIVNAIVNGDNGDVWVGTEKGLIRIINGPNGESEFFEKSNSESSIVSNNIKDLAWDSLRKVLWIATIDGITRYIHNEIKFFNIQPKPYDDSIV